MRVPHLALSRAAALAALVVFPCLLRAQVVYTESSTASDLTSGQTCNGVSTTVGAPMAMVRSGATTASRSITVTGNSSRTIVFYSPSGDPNKTSWPAGNWTINLNVNIANQNITWTSTCIFRVSSTGANLGTVFSGAAGAGLGTTGVKSVTVSGAAQTANATDRIAVVIVLTNAKADNQSVTIDLGNSTNDTITTPFTTANYSASPTESLSSSDAAAGQLTALRGLGEALSLSDSTGRILALSRSPLDTLTASDTASASRGQSRFATDSLTASDALASQMNASRFASESLAPSDSVAGSHGNPRAVLESLTLSEVSSGQLSANRSTAESLTIADSPGRILAAVREPAETLSTADAASRTAALLRATTETLTLSDAAGRTAGWLRSAAETLTVSDLASASRSGGASIALTESVTVSESLVSSVGLFAGLMEGYHVAESLSRSAGFGRSAVDTLAVSDSVAGGRSLLRGLAEVTALAEAIGIGRAKERAITDGLSIADRIYWYGGRQLAVRGATSTPTGGAQAGPVPRGRTATEPSTHGTSAPKIPHNPILELLLW